MTKVTLDHSCLIDLREGNPAGKSEILLSCSSDSCNSEKTELTLRLHA